MSCPSLASLNPGAAPKPVQAQEGRARKANHDGLAPAQTSAAGREFRGIWWLFLGAPRLAQRTCFAQAANHANLACEWHTREEFRLICLSQQCRFEGAVSAERSTASRSS
jgi:hypothetical protein